MAAASNTPFSRPVDIGVTPDADLGGIMWSNKHGFFFAPQDEFLPIKPPTGFKRD